MHTNEFNYWKYTYKSKHLSIIFIKSQYYHIARLNQVHIITLQFHSTYISNRFKYSQLYILF